MKLIDFLEQNKRKELSFISKDKQYNNCKTVNKFIPEDISFHGADWYLLRSSDDKFLRITYEDLWRDMIINTCVIDKIKYIIN